jgi:hypothetical protein
VELTEVARRKDADGQSAEAERKDVNPRPQMKLSDLYNQQISDACVEAAPKNIDG